MHSEQLKIQLTSPVADGSQTFSTGAGRPVTFGVKLATDCAETLAPSSQVSVKVAISGGELNTLLNYAGEGKYTTSWTPRSGRRSIIARITALYVVTRSLPPLLEQVDVPVAVDGTTIAPLGTLVDAASLERNAPVAPGGLVTIFGEKLAARTSVAERLPLPAELAGTRVTIGGRTLPLAYASESQLNVQIPYELPVNSEQQLVIQREGTVSSSEYVVVVAAQPAIFTQDQSGKGAGIIVHGLTNAIVSREAPAVAGETIVVYCTGLGQVSPPISAVRRVPGPREL